MGFWSSLAGIASTAVGFIPGVGPIASGLIKAGLGVGGAIGDKVTGGGAGGNGGSSLLSPDIGTPYSNPGVKAGEDTLASSKGYLQNIMGGDQTTTQGLLGPEVSTVLAQYDNAAKTAANLGPRGGGRTALLAEAPFKKAAAYGQALAGARKGAAGDLATIGKSQSDIGLADQAQKNQYKVAQGNLNVSQNRTLLDQQEQKNKAYADLGTGIGGILTNIISGGSSVLGPKSSTDSNLSTSDQYKLGF